MRYSLSPERYFENRDPRCAATIVAFGTEFLGYIYDPGVKEVKQISTGKMVKNNDSRLVQQYASFNGLCLKKGVDAEWTDDFATDANVNIMRYADVLLMYAEAINEYAGAPDDQAKEAIREIRKRAGVKTDESLLGDYRSFRDLVRNERGRELAFEGLRKWDLIRWGTFVEKMHNAGTNQPTENKYRNVSYTNYASANYANVTARHIYLPIPTKELAVNHALRQNPLW